MSPHHTKTYVSWENQKYPVQRAIECMNRIDGNNFRALFAVLYLTGCRMEEILPYTGKQDFEDKSCLKKKQVDIDPINQNRVTFHGIRNLKRHVFKSKKEHVLDAEGRPTAKYHLTPIPEKRNKTPNLSRNIGISIGPEEQPFWDTFKKYMDSPNTGEEMFLNTKKRTAYNRFCTRTWRDPKGRKHEKVNGGINPHAIRHQRFTQMVDAYDLNPQQLRRHAGWASSSTADEYVEANVKDIQEKQERKQILTSAEQPRPSVVLNGQGSITSAEPPMQKLNPILPISVPVLLPSSPQESLPAEHTEEPQQDSADTQPQRSTPAELPTPEPQPQPASPE